jgi:cyclase
MLKKRIIAVLVVHKGIVVQSLGFDRYLPVGSPSIAVEFLNNWGIDEIILLDIDASKQNRGPDLELVSKCAKYCFVPLTVGGGIKKIADIRSVLAAGADKVCVNSIFLDCPNFIAEASAVFGNQCIVVSLDFLKDKVYSYQDRKDTGHNCVVLAKKAQSLGAGEIFINSVSRDGAKVGFDITFIKCITEEVNIPIIAAGGAGHPDHCFELLNNTEVCAVAVGNMFNFTEHSVIAMKRYIKSKGQSVRINTYADYGEHKFDSFGRIARHSDDYLSCSRFIYHPEEII